MVSKGDKKETIDNLYESYLSLQSSELYVPDISNCKSNSDVEVVVLVESPAKEEINHKPTIIENSIPSSTIRRYR